MPFPPLSGLKLRSGIMSFEFTPTIGILARDIDKLGIDIRSFREPLRRAVKEVMIPSIKKNFDNEGRPAWEPMSEATQTIRSRDGNSGKLLNRSGNLKKNMGYTTMWDFTTEYAIIKDLPQRIWYGKIHQEGLGGMRTRVASEIKKAAKAGKAISPGEAAKRATASIDRQILSGQAQKQSTLNIPARPFVMFQPEDEQKVEEIFEEWLGQRAARAGWS